MIWLPDTQCSLLLQEKQGDVLVFMNTAAGVTELVQAAH